MTNKEILKKHYEIDMNTLLTEATHHLNLICNSSNAELIKLYGLNDTGTAKDDVRDFFLDRCLSGVRAKCFSNYYCENRMDELRTQSLIVSKLDLNINDKRALSGHLSQLTLQEVKASFDKVSKMIDDFDPSKTRKHKIK